MPSVAALPMMPVRGLSADDAARYMGMSKSKFLELVGDGRVPDGFKVDRLRLWDVRDLDAAFDALKGGGSESAAAGERPPVDDDWKGVAP